MVASHLIHSLYYWQAGGSHLTNMFPKSGIEGLISFLFKFGLPAALFTAIIGFDLAKIFDPTFFINYGLAATFILLMTIIVYLKVFGRGLSTAAISGIGTMSSNGMMIGFPLFYSIFGDTGALGVVLVVMVQDILLIPLIILLSEIGQQGQGDGKIRAIRRALRHLITSPIVIAVIAGTLCSLFRVAFPEWVIKPLSLLSQTVAGGGLFLIGAMLVGVKLMEFC